MQSLNESDLKPHDKVLYGVVPGIILGIYNKDKVLFLSDYSKENFYSFNEIRHNDKQNADVFFFFLIDKFGPSVRGGLARIIEQRRFLSIPLSDIKSLESDAQSMLKALLKKRHLYLVMARNYIRDNKPNEKIYDICSRIEALQAKIESHPLQDS